MSPSKIPPELVHNVKVYTQESLAFAEQRFDLLVSLFPHGKCCELLRLTQKEWKAEFVGEVVPDFGKDGLELLQDPDMSEADIQQLAETASAAGKQLKDLPEPTPEVLASSFADEAKNAACGAAMAWLEALFYACTHPPYEDDSARDKKPVRLDSSLLPPPDATILKKPINLAEGMINFSSATLTMERAREVVSIFMANVVERLNQELAGCPEGVDVNGDGLVVCKDEDGFYLLPRPKE